MRVKINRVLGYVFIFSSGNQLSLKKFSTTAHRETRAFLLCFFNFTVCVLWGGVGGKKILKQRQNNSIIL